jgi:hypothetical protein
MDNIDDLIFEGALGLFTVKPGQLEIIPLIAT